MPRINVPNYRPRRTGWQIAAVLAAICAVGIAIIATRTGDSDPYKLGRSLGSSQITSDVLEVSEALNETPSKLCFDVLALAASSTANGSIVSRFSADDTEDFIDGCLAAAEDAR